MLHKAQRLAQDLVEIKRRHFRVGVFRERTDAPNDLTRPSAVSDDPLEGGVRFDADWAGRDRASSGMPRR